MSVPFFGQLFEFTQPNGTKITVRGWGDQHGALFRTAEGHPIVQNRVTGFYEYATIGYGNQLAPTGRRTGLDVIPATPLAAKRFSSSETKSLILSNPGLPRMLSRWRIRSERKRYMIQSTTLAGLTLAPPSRKTVGTFVGLCILIDFPDVPGTIAPEQVEAFLNGQIYNGFGNAGSVRQYFQDVSGGRVNYTSIVTPYITAANNRDHYTDEHVPQPVRARELIAEALAYLKSTGFDFTRLTADDEQYIYAINIYYAGPCVNNWSKGLWPHSSSLASPVEMHPGFKAYDYQFTNMGAELTLGTFCHENGHMICDFPDLYDYGNESAGAGQYCLMCGGGNVDPKNPTQVGAYLKYRAGWSDSLNRLTVGTNGILAAAGNHFYLFAKDEQEYFILENRRNLGRDASLPCAGLAIWHVDELGSNNNEQGTVASHYECALMQADGHYDLEHGANSGDGLDLFPIGGRTNFSDSTVPSSRWWTGEASGLSIYSIRDTAGTITFSS